MKLYYNSHSFCAWRDKRFLARDGGKRLGEAVIWKRRIMFLL